MKIRSPHVDIVVPVFNARKDVEKCLSSVIKHARGAYTLVVVDDRSTDPELVRYLNELEQKASHFVLLRPERNGGFVQSANLGMRYSVEQAKKRNESRDVLLLNSDTIVFSGFLERLQKAVYADGSTGIVSPFSNNATICSIPKFCEDNPLPDESELDDYASVIAERSLRQRPEIVTAVGFCFYIRSAVMRKIGFFDPVYGRGFGEENDFCELAKEHGFSIRLADDVFVAHTGKASFGAEGKALEHENMKVLLSRHPHYLEDVAEFCESNPLREVQVNANFHTKRKRTESFPAILHVIHSNPFLAAPGGSEHYVLDLVKGMKAPRSLIVFPGESSLEVREVINGNIAEPIGYTFPQSSMSAKVAYSHPETSECLSKIVDLFHVSVAHLHHFFNWPVDIWRVFADRSIPYFAMLHDFFAVCPSHNLFNYSQMTPCACNGDPSVTKCCLEAYSATAHTSLSDEPVRIRELHRAAFDKLLSHAGGVIAPSRKVIELVRERVSVDLACHVVPHGYEVRREILPSSVQNPEVLRIGILGNVNYPNKGAANYLEVIRGTHLSSVEYHFFGDVSGFEYEESIKKNFRPGKIIFHGAYKRADICRFLREEGIGLVLVLPACHETFSYTLSESLIAGIPVLALPMGSLKERLENAGLKECLCDSVPQVIERVLYYASYRNEVERLRALVAGFEHETVETCVNRIREVYSQAGEELWNASEGVHPEQLRRLFEHHFATTQVPDRALVPVISADSYRPAWWRPIWSKLGTVSRKIDRHVQQYYFRQRVRVIQSFPFQTIAKMCALSPDTELVQERAKIVAFRAKGKDPFLVFPQSKLPADRVDCLRLKIRCETSRRAKAQLFWTHSDKEGFSEEKSCRIPLRRTDAWQDVIVDLRSWPEREKWTAANEIISLRLDQLDCEGYFELEDLTFAQFS